ncbi:MAG: rab family small GTPase [Satyrvirus sp.]|uniref:Rab family small GTPase n=1 Tax=Satyrvirus sp. TaxID=2487771 RepID=A0A3G5AF68_9VIRU|nr:MAG: rab family small GTPase [Satyrvirus sp.]
MNFYDYTIKLVIAGEYNVGKSSIMTVYCDNIYSDIYNSTIGVDFRTKTILMNGKKIKVQIWDVAGQDKYRQIATVYYRGASGIILVFDLTNIISFAKLDIWINEIKQNSINSWK